LNHVRLTVEHIDSALARIAKLAGVKPEW